MAKKHKTDQLIVPISLAEGMALRATAAKLGLSIAALIRMLLYGGLEKEETIRPIYDTFYDDYNTKTEIELLQDKVFHSKRR